MHMLMWDFGHAQMPAAMANMGLHPATVPGLSNSMGGVPDLAAAAALHAQPRIVASQGLGGTTVCCHPPFSCASLGTSDPTCSVCLLFVKAGCWVAILTG
jgi:hypothetical protein